MSIQAREGGRANGRREGRKEGEREKRGDVNHAKETKPEKICSKQSTTAKLARKE